MRFLYIPTLLLVAACGGSGQQVTEVMQDAEMPTAPADPTPPVPADPTPPTQPTIPPTITRQVESPLNLVAGENISTFEFDSFNVFDDATPAALISSEVSGIAAYNGGMAARIGSDSEFLTGEMRLLVSFRAGTVSGRMRALVFGGDDQIASTVGVNPFETLDITAGTVSGNTLTASLTGTFEEGGLLSAPADEHTVDATLDVVFVDSRPNDASTEMVGTVNGDITSGAAGTRSLSGIVFGESGF